MLTDIESKWASMGLIRPATAAEVIHVGHVNIIKVSDYIDVPKVTFYTKEKTDTKPRYTMKWKSGFVDTTPPPPTGPYYVYLFF